MKRVEIMYFGMIAEAAGVATDSLDISHEMTVQELRELLVNLYDSLSNMQFKIAVNEEIVEPDHIIPENAKIAVLPPFAGG